MNDIARRNLFTVEPYTCRSAGEDRMTDRFQLVAPYKPAGDQPQAIERLTHELRGGPCAPDAARRDRLGQDLHDRERDREDPEADAGARAEQDAGGAALWRVQGILPAQRGRVLRQLLRLLPARGVRAFERHVHREGCLDQRAHRADAPFGDEGAAVAAGCADRRDRVGDLRPRRSERIPQDAHAPDARRAHRLSAR